MALCVLCKKTNKQGALLGLSRVCRQITKATGKSMSMMATRPRSLTGSKVLPYTCDLQVGRRAAAIRAPVSALKLWNCLRYLIASSTELECALMDAHAYCQVQHRRSLPRQRAGAPAVATRCRTGRVAVSSARHAASCTGRRCRLGRCILFAMSTLNLLQRFAAMSMLLH